MKYRLITILLITVWVLTILKLPVLAQTLDLLSGETADENIEQTEAFLEAAGFSTTPAPPGVIVAEIIRVVLSLLGVLFIVLVIYAGFKWMTSTGNEEAISKAKKTLAAAVIGLTIILAAYLITSFVIDQLLFATTAYY